VVFVHRAAIVALATFVSGLAGIALHWALPVASVVASKGMLASVVGLVASLLSLVLSLLIWTGYGVFSSAKQVRWRADALALSGGGPGPNHPKVVLPWHVDAPRRDACAQSPSVNCRRCRCHRQ